MNGWQRFGLLLLGCVAIMILYPDYGTRGWPFVGMLLAAGAGVFLVLSVVSNLFAIYRFAFLNKLITLGVIAAICYVLLWYFPQTDGLTPIQKLKAGRTPTKDEMIWGLKKLSFNFDFVRRNVRRDENFVNQQTIRNKPASEKTSVKPVAPQTNNSNDY